MTSDRERAETAYYEAEEEYSAERRITIIEAAIREAKEEARREERERCADGVVIPRPVAGKLLEPAVWLDQREVEPGTYISQCRYCRASSGKYRMTDDAFKMDHSGYCPYHLLQEAIRALADDDAEDDSA